MNRRHFLARTLAACVAALVPWRRAEAKRKVLFLDMDRAQTFVCDGWEWEESQPHSWELVHQMQAAYNKARAQIIEAQFTSEPPPSPLPSSAPSPPP